MQFGITFKPDMTVERIVALTRQAEAAGFQYGWIFDSHVLWLQAVPVADIDGDEYKAYADGDVRHESGGARYHGDLEPVCHAELDIGRADGTGHWARGQFAARHGQEAGDVGASGRIGEGVSRTDGGARGRV